MVFVGCHPTPRKGLAPLDPRVGEDSAVFQTNDGIAWRVATRGFLSTVHLCERTAKNSARRFVSDAMGGKRMRVVMRFLAVCGWFVSWWSGLVGCVPMPTQKEAKQAQSLWEMAVQQNNRGEFRAAMALLHRAEKLNPRSYWVQEALGVTLLRMRRPDLAQKHFERALEIEPNSPRGWGNLGVVFSALRNWKRAIVAYEKALSNVLYQTPCNAEVSLGWAYHMDGQPEKAVSSLIQGISHCPTLCQGHRLLGLVYKAQGKWKEAEESLREVVQRCNKFSPGYYHLARALVPQKKYRDALLYLQKCADLSEGKEPAVRRACAKLTEEIQGKQAVEFPRKQTAAVPTSSVVVKPVP